MPAGPLVNLVDVRTYLNVRGADNDDELSGFLEDAVGIVEGVIGPITAASVTEVFDLHGPRLVLSRTPVQSVQQVTIQPWLGAAPVDDTAGWVPNPDTGVLRRQLTGGTLPWLGRGSIVQVTYTAGRATVPGPVNRAVLMQVASMWKSQRGAAATRSQQQQQGQPSVDGLIGADVMDLLTPFLPSPGMA